MNKRETDRLFMEKLREVTGFADRDIARLAKAPKLSFERLIAPYVLILNAELTRGRRRRRPKTA